LTSLLSSRNLTTYIESGFDPTVWAAWGEVPDQVGVTMKHYLIAKVVIVPMTGMGISFVSVVIRV